MEEVSGGPAIPRLSSGLSALSHQLLASGLAKGVSCAGTRWSLWGGTVVGRVVVPVASRGSGGGLPCDVVEGWEGGWWGVSERQAAERMTLALQPSVLPAPELRCNQIPFATSYPGCVPARLLTIRASSADAKSQS